MNKEEKHIYTVSEITRYMRAIIEDSFPAVWVEGEISNFVLHSSGHMYFSLRDSNAVLKSAMFSRANAKLKFRPKDGMKVICFGKMSLYEPRGDYQLIVEDIEPKGVGALQLQFQELKEKLMKEGLFDESHKIPVPHLPTRIGIVTSPTGAAIHDILNVVRRRFANIEIIINPVRVQGEGAKDEIAEAIRDFNRFGAIDVMIVARGGGSLEDLWAFNEEVVARAIYDSELPVISAVGHEVDYTISDFVADLRAPTPSAAAELVIPRKEDLSTAVESAVVRLKHALIAKIDILEERVKALSDSYILRQPLNVIEQHEQRIDDLRKDLADRMGHIVDMRGENFRLLAGKLGVLNPLAILNRGYSITTNLADGFIVKDASRLKEGDKVETKLATGKFVGRVESVG
ncbi:MAG: exodeoxyribonuclease VII large subunit [Candidatus Omnitrophica bacterium]|nr:exodeoxyribonuclease VII large subunit [Candidatus Omnitrophota bacterium]